MSAEASHVAATERHAYLPVEGDLVYTVRHAAQGKARAAVLLCGPIGAERERAYRTMVNLARALAGAGVDVMRLDYRGIGESTGEFPSQGFSRWKHDIEACAAALRGECPGIPQVLWGVRSGAILASECFRDGLGDAAMFCAPLGGAQPMLMEVLRRTLMAEMLANPGAPRTTREEIVAQLGAGELVNVDGYLWSRGLWSDAESHGFVVPAPDDGRPWLLVDIPGHPKAALPAHAESNRRMVASDRFWEALPYLVPRTPTFQELTVDWVTSLIGSGG